MKSSWKKFQIFFICDMKTQNCLFNFSLHSAFNVFPNELKSEYQYRPGHSLGEKMLQHQIKKWLKQQL